MRASIIVTDNSGNKWEMELPLRKIADEDKGASPNALKRAQKQSGKSRDVASSGPTTAPQSNSEMDFTLPLRPFMNQYARGSSGSRKFALLVAHCAKGEVSVEVPFLELQKQWAKMKGILGAFNAAFTTRAKNNGWVDSPSRGVYVLLPGWKQGAENG